LNLGSAALYWANSYANQIYGTLMTSSQPNILAGNSTLFAGYTWAAPAALGTGTANSGTFTTVSVANLTSTSNVATFGTAAYVVANGNIGIGNSTPANKLTVFGDINLDGISVRNTANTTTASVSQFTLFSYSNTLYGSAEVSIQATQGTERHFTKLLVTANTTVALATEYGSIFTGSSLFTTEVSMSAGTVSVLLTPASTTSTTFKSSYELITL
jgi:hypothetical protein